MYQNIQSVKESINQSINQSTNRINSNDQRNVTPQAHFMNSTSTEQDTLKWWSFQMQWNIGVQTLKHMRGNFNSWVYKFKHVSNTVHKSSSYFIIISINSQLLVHLMGYFKKTVGNSQWRIILPVN